MLRGLGSSGGRLGEAHLQRRYPLRSAALSGPISRDIAIPSLLYFSREVSTPPKWCDTPRWHLVSHKRICAIPHFATYRGVTVRYPIKTSTQGPLNGGVSNGGVSRSGLVLPFLSFFVLLGLSRGFSPICSGTVRGFSRFVLFLFLGLLTAPTRNSPERVRDTIRTFPEKSGKHPGLETPRFSFSQSTKEFCDTIATSIARYENYRCWASKVLPHDDELFAMGAVSCWLSLVFTRHRQFSEVPPIRKCPHHRQIRTPTPLPLET